MRGRYEHIERTSEVERLRKQVDELRAALVGCVQVLDHYAREDVRNARHYPPEYAKDFISEINQRLRE